MLVPAVTYTTATDGLQTTSIEEENISFVNEDIRTELMYLVKDARHETEKPYDLRFDAGSAIPRTNMANESRPVVIHDFRHLQNSRSLQEYGFTSAKIERMLTAAEFSSDKIVEAIYYPEVINLLWRQFPGAAEIKILEHILRKRHPSFPQATKEDLDFLQPAMHAHNDFTTESAARTAISAFKTAAETYKRLVAVNVWKSFQGPGNDWPLALCDRRTIDYSVDTIAADVVYHNKFNENERLYYSPRHEWYYFKDMEVNEVILFRQTDSEITGGGGTAHASFFNPSAEKNAAPRASIELRAFVFFA